MLYLKNGKRYKRTTLIQKKVPNLIGFQKDQLIHLSYCLMGKKEGMAG